MPAITTLASRIANAAASTSGIAVVGQTASLTSGVPYLLVVRAWGRGTAVGTTLTMDARVGASGGESNIASMGATTTGFASPGEGVVRADANTAQSNLSRVMVYTPSVANEVVEVRADATATADVSSLIDAYELTDVAGVVSRSTGDGTSGSVATPTTAAEQVDAIDTSSLTGTYWLLATFEVDGPAGNEFHPSMQADGVEILGTRIRKNTVANYVEGFFVEDVIDLTSIDELTMHVGGQAGAGAGNVNVNRCDWVLIPESSFVPGAIQVDRVTGYTVPPGESTITGLSITAGDSTAMRHHIAFIGTDQRNFWTDYAINANDTGGDRELPSLGFGNALDDLGLTATNDWVAQSTFESEVISESTTYTILANKYGGGVTTDMGDQAARDTEGNGELKFVVVRMEVPDAAVELAADLASSSTLAATLTSQRALSTALSSSSSVVADLVTTAFDELTTDLDSSSALVSDLAAARAIAAALASQSAIDASPEVVRQMFTDLASSSTLTGDLVADEVTLASAVASSSALASDMAAARAIAAALASHSNVTASMLRVVAMNVTIATASTILAVMTSPDLLPTQRLSIAIAVLGRRANITTRGPR